VSDKGEQKRILIVDDDPLLRGLCSFALEPAGHELVQAGGGEQAVELFSEARTDLVILDVQMRGIDGYETCRRIRALPGGDNIPVIMLTGLDDAESIERAYESGATDFIAKPFQWPLLVQRVRYALRAAVTAEISRQATLDLARAQEMAQLGSWSMDQDGSLQCSAALLRILGFPDDHSTQLTRDEQLALVVDSDRLRIERARQDLAMQSHGYEAVYVVRRVDGVLRTVYEQASLLCDARGKPARMEGITQDITDRVEAERRIQQLASHDALTGLPNRDYFQKLLAAGLERAREGQWRSAVLQLDIDRFKGVNDALGAAAGDLVLKAVAYRLCKAFGASSGGATPRGDALGRMGANAFVIYMAQARDVSDVADMAQRLLDAVSAPIDVGGREIMLSACMGIALQPRDSGESLTLLRCAEQALRVAKQDASATFLFFDQSIRADAGSQMAVETDLRRALVNGDELRMYLQPKVDVRSCQVVGAEALIRWEHPQRGLIMPADFIPLAEKTGLIRQVTEWMLEQACRQCAAWEAEGRVQVPIAVNVSASWLAGRGLIEHIKLLLQRYQLEPSSIVLEVTESLLARDIGNCIESMRELRQLGVAISLDDFGTGYSSLSYLKVMPLDELKLDRAFVTDIGNSKRDQSLAASIITLAKRLELGVVAEGVETKAQAEILAAMGCHVQQGYLYSKPIPSAGFSMLLAVDGQAAPAQIA
jgi:diguanylate cyclase (GGDEF)-like protein/PAS domain S-box-containing protein